MKLSIIIVSWNVKEELVNCLRSIEENRPSEKFEVIVVDNASTDDTPEAIKRDFPEITLVSNSKNRGFAAANNQGIERSQGEYLLFLNPDTIIHAGSLDVLVKFMDGNSNAGVCGPKLLNADGTTQPSARRFPTFRGALYRHTFLRFLRIFRSEYKKWLMKDFKHDRQMDVNQLMGSALMVRRSVIEQVGDMDESFFMYYEEVDLCCRIKKAGWRIVFVPEAATTHLGGQSAGQIPARKRMMMLTSMLIFFRKHRGKFATGVFGLIFKPGVIVRDILNIFSGGISYLISIALYNHKKRLKSLAKMKKSMIFLRKYSWEFVFKI